MSMDRPRRYNVRRVVNEARRLLEDEITKRVLYYGIRSDGTTLDPARLPHLTPADLETRRRLDQAIEKEMVGGLTRRQAVARYIRHVGFTYLNRFAALRAMEVRGFIKETIIPRARYGGRSLRERDIAEANPSVSPDQALRQSLLQAFREVGQEIKVLFDTDDEYSLVFPEVRTCRDLIQLLSEEIPEEDWHEDEIIGWIYQYYNEEARAEFKKSRRKPTADDIPVINQFYTPHWVVRVLADNTLGRLWLEMQGRIPNQRISESANGPTSRDEAEWVICDQRIGVPDPKAAPETFAAWLHDAASVAPADTVDTFCSYLVPLRNEPPPREKKQAREIKVLDPAVGSGHFLVYAFDILYRIYREDEPDTPLHEIPALILEHNLYGIDIDLRAVQLAALSLYLKARAAYEATIQESDESPESVVPFRIRKLNLVCADARIADGRRRAEFLRRFAHDRALQMLFARLFEDLNNTNELGSLLKVRKPFERLLEARKAKLMEPPSPQMHLPEFKQQLDLSDIESAVRREQTLEDMLGALRQFEREAIEAQDMGTLLFATEAEKSVGLLALLSQKYDVVLMNPPYGRFMPEATKSYLEAQYPLTHGNLYSAFIEQAIDLTTRQGYSAGLTSSTFLHFRSFETLREKLFTNRGRPTMVIDFGHGILDEATVSTAGTVFASLERQGLGVPIGFCKLVDYEIDDKHPVFELALSELHRNEPVHRWYWADPEDLSVIPGTPYIYWAPSRILQLFKEKPPLDCDVSKKHHTSKIADVKQGIATSDNARFARRFWELEPGTIGRSNQPWVPYARGDGPFTFYADITWALDWNPNGNLLREAGATIRNQDFYFRPGLTYRLGGMDFRRIAIFPEGCVFDVGSSCIFPVDPSYVWPLLAFLNSRLMLVFILHLSPVGLIVGEHSHKWQVGDVASVPIAWRLFDKGHFLEDVAREIYSLLREWDTGEETWDGSIIG